MCGKGKGSQTQTQQNQNVQYTPYGIQNLQNIYNAAANAASQPYRPYTGEMVADWNKQQQGALRNLQGIANRSGNDPYMNRGTDMMNAAYQTGNQYTRQAVGMIDRAADPISGRDIRRYQDPYTNQVVDATMANIQENNQAQQQQLMGNSAMRGALGGDRSAVMQAELARQQNLASNQTVGNLRSQGYSQALNAAMAQQQAQMAGGYQIGALGQSQSGQMAGIGQGMAGLGFANQQNDIAANQALLGAATQKQGWQQNELNAQYQQYQQMMAYPYQQAQFLASIGIPAASAMGGFQTQIGDINQVYRPPFWNLNTGGAVPFRRGGSDDDDDLAPERPAASHYFGVGNPNTRLPFGAGRPIYLPGQTIQPQSQLIGPNGLFYAGQNPADTPNQGRIYNAVPISGMTTPNQAMSYINSNPDRVSYRPTNDFSGPGGGGKPPHDGMVWDPKLRQWVDPPDDGPPPTYADGGDVPMPWETQPFSISGGNSPYPGIGGGQMAPIQVPDAKPTPMPMASPSPPPQQGKGPLQSIGDLTKLYNMGKKGTDWLGRQLTPSPTDISAPGVGQTTGATMSQGSPGGTAGFGGYGELGGSAIPSAAPATANPATAVGTQFLQGQAASSPGLAAGVADTAAGAAGAEGLAGIGASAGLGEAAAAAAAETGLGAATGAAGLEAIGTAAAAEGAAAFGGMEALTALLALLSTGGRVYADGGGVDENHPSTVPETLDTLRSQQNQLIRGVRKVQMFPPGTKELPLPRGLARVETQFGVFHYNPSRVSQEQIVNMAQSGRENELLDLGPFSKTDIINRAKAGEKPIAVVERDHRGREVKTAAGTEKTAPQQMEVFTKTRTPGNIIRIEDPRSVLSERMSANQSSGMSTGGGVDVDYNENPYLKFLDYVTGKDKAFAFGGEVDFEEQPVSGNISIPEYATEDLYQNDDRWRYPLKGLDAVRGGQPPQQFDPEPHAAAEEGHSAVRGTYPTVTSENFSPTADRTDTPFPQPRPPLEFKPPMPRERPAEAPDTIAARWPTPDEELKPFSYPMPKERPANAPGLIEARWPKPSEQFKPMPASTEMTAKTGTPLPRPRPYGEDDDPSTANQRAAAAAGYSGDSPEMQRAVMADNSRTGRAASGAPFGQVFGRSPHASRIAAAAQERGYTPVQTAAILAHAKRESNFNPNARGDAGKAFGFFQWHPDRRPPDNSPDGQISHMFAELDGPEKKAGEMLRNAKTPEEANAAMAQYERFKGYNDPNSQEYMARLNLTRQGAGLDPTRMTPAEIMDRSNFQGSDRKTVGQMASDPDFWMRALVNIGASDFTHGSGPMLFQGLSKTIGNYDEFAKENMTAQQKGQDLAQRLYSASRSKFQAVNYTDESGRLAAGAFDPATGRTYGADGKPVIPGSYAGRPGQSGKASVFEQKRQAFLTINPGDEKGALEFASGNKRMSPQEIRVKSIAAAQKMIANMPVPPKDPVAETNRLASEIEKRLIGGFEESKDAAVSAAAGGKDGSTADKALPDPGDGKREKDKWYIAPDGKPRQWQG